MKRVFGSVILWLLFIILVSGWLTPWIYWSLQEITSHSFPVRRIFNRVLLVSALIGLWPLIRFWGVTSLKSVGVQKFNSSKKWIDGFAIGLLTMGALGLLHLYTGAHIIEKSLSFQKSFLFLLMALGVGIVEEFLFRGVLFLGAARFFSSKQLITWAIGINFFFALVHFLKAPDVASPVTWKTGWVIWSNIWPAWNEDMLWRFLVLWEVGLLLCSAVWRTRTIWLSAGIHAGWVFLLKSAAETTHFVGSPSPFLREDWAGGGAALLLLAGMIFFLLKGVIFTQEKAHV